MQHAIIQHATGTCCRYNMQHATGTCCRWRKTSQFWSGTSARSSSPLRSKFSMRTPTSSRRRPPPLSVAFRVRAICRVRCHCAASAGVAEGRAGSAALKGRVDGHSQARHATDTCHTPGIRSRVVRGVRARLAVPTALGSYDGRYSAVVGSFSRQCFAFFSNGIRFRRHFPNHAGFGAFSNAAGVIHWER